MKRTRQCLIVLVVAWLPSALLAQDLNVDFRNKKVDEKDLTFEGPDFGNYVKLEDEGLRWRYDGKSPTKPIGVRWNMRLQGDFTAVAHYEIFKVGQPNKGNGVGIELYVVFATPGTPRDAIAFGRLVTPAGPLHAYNYMTNNEAGKRTSRDAVRRPTTEKSHIGKLRVIRKGTKVTSSVAEGDGPFEDMHPEPREIGDMDVLMFRVSALDGGDPTAELDLRLLQFTLTGRVQEAQGKTPLAVPPAPTDLISPTGSGRWVFWVLALVAVLVIGAFGVIFLAVLLTRKKKPTTASKASGATPTVAIALACESCGKRLKVQENARGKAVKCPGCGNTMRVPQPAAKS
jgi:hypothetical protein